MPRALELLVKVNVLFIRWFWNLYITVYSIMIHSCRNTRSARILHVFWFHEQIWKKVYRSRQWQSHKFKLGYSTILSTVLIPMAIPSFLPDCAPHLVGSPLPAPIYARWSFPLSVHPSCTFPADGALGTLCPPPEFLIFYLPIFLHQMFFCVIRLLVSLVSILCNVNVNLTTTKTILNRLTQNCRP